MGSSGSLLESSHSALCSNHMQLVSFSNSHEEDRNCEKVVADFRILRVLFLCSSKAESLKWWIPHHSSHIFISHWDFGYLSWLGRGLGAVMTLSSVSVLATGCFFCSKFKIHPSIHLFCTFPSREIFQVALGIWTPPTLYYRQEQGPSIVGSSIETHIFTPKVGFSLMPFPGIWAISCRWAKDRHRGIAFGFLIWQWPILYIILKNQSLYIHTFCFTYLPAGCDGGSKNS